jgi:hypothetical protein
MRTFRLCTVLSSLWFFAACTEPSESAGTSFGDEGKLISNQVAQKGQFPSVVFMRRYRASSTPGSNITGDDFACTPWLGANNKLVVAAHCIFDKDSEESVEENLKKTIEKSETHVFFGQ